MSNEQHLLFFSLFKLDCPNRYHLCVFMSAMPAPRVPLVVTKTQLLENPYN